MEYVLLGILFFFGYPFIAHAIASRSMSARIEELKQEIASLQISLQDLRTRVNLGLDMGAPARPPAPAYQPAPVEPQPEMATSPPETKPEPPPEPESAPELAAAFSEPERADAVDAPPVSTPMPEPEPFAQPASPPRVEYEPSPPPAWLVAARQWLFTGNLVAKMGLLILFIGVSFLLKYAAERVTIPIEVRLAAIVVADIGLLAWGWRMRLTRRTLSLPIQGTALAILMLVTFGAFRMYQLIPSGLAFGLLFVLTAFTCLLAVLQNAVWLAVFGIAGGFMAPIMTSTGQGSHIALFSYYALLNAGILAIALKRTWRALNLLGFAFTFVIGTTWGVLRYSQDEHYLSSQLFLILFFVFYVAIALIYAARQLSEQKSHVDATLVFGTPLAAFGLQLGLMRGVEYGNAFSALGLGLFYTVLALALWRRRRSGVRMLVESSLALGLVFGTLALPFALDARWTSAAWALEGAAVVWAGLRQKQRRTWMFGLLVQAGAWLAFIAAVSGMGGETARETNLWLGFLMLAGAAFFMATTFRRHADSDQIPAIPMATIFLTGAGVWFMAGAWTEIILHTSGVATADLLAASGLATAVILTAIGTRMAWRASHQLALLAQLVAGGALLIMIATEWDWSRPAASLSDRPLIGALLIFAGALFTSWSMWRAQDEPALAPASRAFLLWAAFWWFGPVLNAVSGWLVMPAQSLTEAGGHTETWSSLYGICLAVSAPAFGLLAKRLQWSSLRWFSAAVWPGLAGGILLSMAILYGAQDLPGTITWVALACLWLASEWMLAFWPARTWHIAPFGYRVVHAVRTAGPWIMLWKTGEILIDGWLHGAVQDRFLLAEGGWQVSGSWANFVPAWAMMLAVAWLIQRSASERWPAAPIETWYRRTLLPLASAWSLLLVALWNLRQDGSMAPLPYIPLLNPLDLSTGFAILLGMLCYRSLRDDKDRAALVDKLPLAAAFGAYAWFNLMLLRSAAHYLDIDYRFDTLFASQFIQAMLSLVWSVTALLLMRRATALGARGRWVGGAALLALVVAKLFLVDLSNVGSVARIVSFVGVGLLMVLIGYLAPYPNPSETAEQKAAA